MKGNVLTKVLLFISIIIIIILCGFAYLLYNENITLNKTASDLETKVNHLETVIENMQEKVDNASKIIANRQYTVITEELDGIDVLYVTKAIRHEDSYTLEGVIYTQYVLDKSDIQQFVDQGYMTINGEKYTIRDKADLGIYELYKDKSDYPLYVIKPTDTDSYYLEAQAQIQNVWKLTGDYRKITIPDDTKCSMNYDYEEKYNTVDDVFKNYKETEPQDITNPDGDKTFTFKFEDGKCVEVISALTSV